MQLRYCLNTCEDIHVVMVTDMYNFSFSINEVDFDFANRENNIFWRTRHSNSNGCLCVYDNNIIFIILALFQIISK